jgi:hypothetical protein
MENDRRLLESDHSNLTTSTLYSTDYESEKQSFSRHNSSSNSNNPNSNDRLSISVSPAHYKSMNSPDLRRIAKHEGNDYRGYLNSVNSTESTADRSIRHPDSTPSSPLRSSNLKSNDALLSPIKLLELASVCSERHSQEQEQQDNFILSTQLSALSDNNLGSSNNGEGNGKGKK